MRLLLCALCRYLSRTHAVTTLEYMVLLHGSLSVRVLLFVGAFAKRQRCGFQLVSQERICGLPGVFLILVKGY